MEEQPLVTHVFRGGRFDDHGIDVDVLCELAAYKAILVEVAKDLWRGHNPKRRRLPRNFEDSLRLEVRAIEPGSVAVPLYRGVREGGEPRLFREPDELDEAVVLVSEAADAAAQDRPVPSAFPRSALELFADYGKALGAGESFEYRIPGRESAAGYTAKARERLVGLAAGLHEDVVDVVGTVTMANVRVPRMELGLDSGTRVEAAFGSEDEEKVTTALKEHAIAKVRVRGVGSFSAAGELERITSVTNLDLLPSGRVEIDASAPPIWEAIREIMGTVPREEFEQLPTDGAEQHDHYVYGTPKR